MGAQVLIISPSLAIGLWLDHIGLTTILVELHLGFIMTGMVLIYLHWVLYSLFL